MVSNLGYVAAAFAVVWVGLFIYIFSLMQKEKTLRRDIASLRDEMKMKAGAG
jgi:CcmD family protein